MVFHIPNNDLFSSWILFMLVRKVFKSAVNFCNLDSTSLSWAELSTTCGATSANATARRHKIARSAKVRERRISAMIDVRRLEELGVSEVDCGHIASKVGCEVVRERSYMVIPGLKRMKPDKSVIEGKE